MALYLKQILFQIYCGTFHLAAIFVASGSPAAIINAAWVVACSSILMASLSYPTDLTAFLFAFAGSLTTIASYSVILLFMINAHAVTHVFPPILIVMQVLGLIASLRSLRRFHARRVADRTEASFWSSANDSCRMLSLLWLRCYQCYRS